MSASTREIVVATTTTQSFRDTLEGGPARKKHSSGSPVSIETDLGVVSKANKEKLLPLTTLTVLIVYSQLVRSRKWDTRFFRGRRASRCRTGSGVDGHECVRRLATHHVGDAVADGWNCVAGAMQLVNAWALRPDEIPQALPFSFELPFDTRLRMAVCLSVSWKFQRALYSHFPRQFYNETDNAHSLWAPHTYELAFIGFSFMKEDEQEQFGGWNTDNVRAIRAMYDEMLRLEVELISYNDVFAMLTNNVQVLAETLLQGLRDRRSEICADCVLAARSLVPLFVYCAASRGPEPSAGAVVCTALLALSTTSNPRAMLPYNPEFFRAEFCNADRRASWDLIDSALRPSNLAKHAIVLGCYKDPTWVNYCFVEPQNLRAAQVAAAAVA